VLGTRDSSGAQADNVERERDQPCTDEANTVIKNWRRFQGDNGQR
jgi:hypothetical protein